MEKYITDERIGLRYELIDGIYYIAGDDDQPEEAEPIGIWGQRHLRFIKEHRFSLFLGLLSSGKINSYLSDIDRQAEDMFFRLVNELAESEGVTEQLKSENQMQWVAKINSIRNRAIVAVNEQVIYN